jgi:hypothetical protein
VTLTAEVYASTAATIGRRFRKHFLDHGVLRHPRTGETITIDDRFVEQLRVNLARRVTGTVPLQLAGPRDEHNDDPRLAIGEVIGIESDGRRVYALLDVHRRADALNKTLIGCSASLSPDYIDVTSLRRVGPAMLHLLVTNRPHLSGLDGYEELAPPVELSDPGPPSQRPRLRFTDEQVSRLTRSLRAQQRQSSASRRTVPRPASGVLPATGAGSTDAEIVRLTALAGELGLSGPRVSPSRRLPGLGR